MTMKLPGLLSMFVAGAVVAVVSLLTGSTAQRRHSEFWGPFRVNPTQLEDCPEDMMPRHKYYNVSAKVWRDRRHTDVWHLSGNATSFMTLNDNLTMELVIDSRSTTAGWKQNFYVRKVPKVFSFWRNGWPGIWGKIMTSAGLPANHGVLFPAGDYSIKDITSDFVTKHPDKLFYGKFRLTSQMKSSATSEVIACGRAMFTIVPKTGNLSANHSKSR